MKEYFRLAFAIRQLHGLRRVNKLEQNFWNHFWRSWNYGDIKEAALQAYRDMAEDKDFKESKILWRFSPHSRYNFERIVAQDQRRFISFLKCKVIYNDHIDSFLTPSDLITQYHRLIDWNLVNGFDIIEEELKTDISLQKVKKEERKLKAEKKKKEEELLKAQEEERRQEKYRNELYFWRKKEIPFDNKKKPKRNSSKK